MINIIKENPNSFANTSINITKEIEKFFFGRNLSSKEISDYHLFSENILFDPIKYKTSESPDVYVILAVSNQAHCIHKGLRSIQNQSLKNIEIIVSVDCTEDNSTEVIKKYIEEDERII